MKKTVIATLLLLMVSACAQQSIPEFSTFNGKQIQLEAVATPGVFDAKVELKINGETIISERTEVFGGSSQSFQGTWSGKQVVARATRVQKFASTYIMIDVFIDGVLVETLVV